jgi:DNA-binding NarL/FixJ family response regulator
MAEWLAGRGVLLTRVPAGPGQMPRYHAIGSGSAIRAAINAGLSEREVHMLRGFSQGKSNAEIGRDLFLSEETIKAYARRLRDTLDARDRAHAVAIGYQRGILVGAE